MLMPLAQVLLLQCVRRLQHGSASGIAQVEKRPICDYIIFSYDSRMVAERSVFGPE